MLWPRADDCVITRFNLIDKKDCGGGEKVRTLHTAAENPLGACCPMYSGGFTYMLGAYKYNGDLLYG